MAFTTSLFHYGRRKLSFDGLILYAGKSPKLKRTAGTLATTIQRDQEIIEGIQQELKPLKEYTEQNCMHGTSAGDPLDPKTVKGVVTPNRYLSSIYPKMLSISRYDGQYNVFDALQDSQKYNSDEKGYLKYLKTILAANWPSNADTRIFCLDLLARLIQESKYDQALSLLATLARHSLSNQEVIIFRNALQSGGFYPRQDVDDVRESVALLLEGLSSLKNSAELKKRDCLTEIIIKNALYEGKPLLASSIWIRLKYSWLSSHTLNSIVTALSISHRQVEPFHLQALHKLLKTFPKSLFYMCAATKSRFISMGIKMSTDNQSLPSIANDVYDLIKDVQGDDIPLLLQYKLLSLNVHCGTLNQAARIWDSLSAKYNNDIMTHNTLILSKLIFAFSKEEKYRSIADSIVRRLPEESYGLEGMTEALLMYCARKKDFTLAEKVYAAIGHPIRRTTLTYLLHLHVLLNDASGTEKILKEIRSRGESLYAEELARLVQSISTVDLEKACRLVERFPVNTSLKAYGAIVNTSIDQKNFPTADEYLDILSHNCSDNNKEIAGLIANLSIKRLVEAKDLQGTRKLWQHWLVNNQIPDKTYQFKALRTILDEYIRENNPKQAIWVINEMVMLGLSMSQIKYYVSQRAAHHNLNTSCKKVWSETIHNQKKREKRN